MERNPAGKPYLGWPDISELFDCGRSKALLIMHKVGVVHVGRSVFVRAADLEAYINERGNIDIAWPKYPSRRKRGFRG